MRRIYIIPKEANPKDFIAEALARNCPEIVQGIPPRLEGVVFPDRLPTIYEEPEPSPTIDWIRLYREAAPQEKPRVIARMLGLEQ